MDGIFEEMDQMRIENGFDETFCTANEETFEKLLQFIQERYVG